MSSKKIDKPSDAEFFDAISDNIPGLDHVVKDVAKGYVLGKAIGYVTKPKK
ncbi:hypothetical protein UFOVP965_25 [uncultured Caudovirales phage]|uniref:Uncharacterized protein n=1 Tax=uncultured Caudovirales phage TaxID=2100421 RepID=A0A6J5PXU4_9CAUD|nr:hypothetical protein UFOVP965_25 [uncultured Caudovirales phage]CAB4179729.1 hypothetical protein UFOVP1035_21 [uncultured Caudovirales phage]CAB4188845.1 hypothetical protein UFOVP1181_127 [uncultured Caudovirales phage]